jgi:uncharacterized spore protein YtfJ
MIEETEEASMSEAVGSTSGTAPAGRGSSFLERLAERVGGAASSTLVFGAPVEHQAVKVIPVAKARWGFGGGGASRDQGGEGSGGGGGVWVSPVGYIEMKDGSSRFRPIHGPTARLPVVLAVGFFTLLIARALGKR